MDDRKILRSAGVVGGLTFCSRMLGMVRDVLMAGFFGTSMAMSGFVIAFMIALCFFVLSDPVGAAHPHIGDSSGLVGGS